MTDRALNFWVGTSPRADWRNCIIAAYTIADAVQLYIQVGGGAGGATSQIRDYFNRLSGLDGNAKRAKLIPLPTRGVYFTDDNYGSVMFIEPATRAIVEEPPEAAKAAAAAAKPPEEYGKLRTGFTRGVRVDMWTYESPHHDRAYADKMVAEVRMQKTDRVSGGRRKWGSGLDFVATSKCFSGELRSPNVEDLFVKVQEAFTTYDIAQRGIVWDDWLEVVTQPEHRFMFANERNSSTGGFSIGYRIIKRGIHPITGRALTIHESNGVVTDFPTAKRAGQKPKDAIDHGDGDEDWGHSERAEQFSYIPATPANVAALDRIIAAIGSARERLETLLQQDAVAKTLASIPNVILLESKS